METDLGAETAPAVIVGGNINNTTAGFADAAARDYHLSAATAGAITGGGQDVDATYTEAGTDKDGVTRDPTWAIGAYEYP